MIRSLLGLPACRRDNDHGSAVVKSTPALVLVASLLVCGPTLAAEPTTATMDPDSHVASYSKSPAITEPANYKSAGLLVSFIDLNANDLGDPLAYLLWGELSSTLGAPPPDYQPSVVSLVATEGASHPLRDNYHVSALTMARERDAPLTFWGVVRRDETSVALGTYVSLRPEVRDPDFLLTVSRSGLDTSALHAGVTRMRYGFETLTLPLDSLFQRRLIVRDKVALQAEPRASSPTVAIADAGAVLAGYALDGPWYQVQDAEGRAGYVHIEQVKVLPTAALLKSDALALHDQPADTSKSRRLTSVRSSPSLLDVAVDVQGGVWYRVRVEGVEGWASPDQLNVAYSLPSLHFLAGLYYLRAPPLAYHCQFQRAAEQFSLFIESTQSTEKNTNLATAHQLFATSQLRSSQSCGRDEQAAMASYSKAIDLTPYDPTAYNLRAVANLQNLTLTQPILADLQISVGLDIQDERTRSLIGGVLRAAKDARLKSTPPLVDEADRLYREMTRSFVARNVARIRQDKHLPMQSRGQRVEPGPAGGVMLTFRNRTGSALDLYVLESQREDERAEGFYLQLEQDKESVLHVQEGTYEIAVEGADPNVTSLYGEHGYTAHSHFSLDFQVKLNDAPLSGW